VIRCTHLTQRFRVKDREVRALDNLELSVAAGDFLVVRGPSGCGKTTLLLTLGAMLRPVNGSVVVRGQDLYALSSAERAQFRARHLGFVFQMFHLVPYLNVLENVLLARPAPPSPAARTRARDLLTRLGLGDRLEHRPAALSAGERQRTAVARALLNEPELILADEPTGNLDPDNSHEVFRHLQSFQQTGGTVVVVTHGAAADAFATRVIRMAAGRILSAD